jgi:cation transport regulator ChaC
MSDLVHIFGYGSLMARPEATSDVVSRQLGFLKGYERSFNKQSRVRGCPSQDAYLAFDMPQLEFCKSGHVSSLAVGTAPANQEIAGVLVTYQADSEAAMLSATDKREGYDAEADEARLGYLRKRVVIRTASASSVDAWVYVSNPSGRYHIPSELSLELRARILINATPRSGTSTANDGRARGLHYLQQIRIALAGHGITDAAVESMTLAVLENPGPWANILTLP